MLGWMRPGLPGLSNFDGYMQHFRSAFWDVWCSKVSADLFSVAPSWIVRDLSSSLTRPMFGKERWHCSMVTDGDGHLFWDCPYLPLVEIRENPEFHDLMRMDKSHWPRCLLWHGWLPLFSGLNGGLVLLLVTVLAILLECSMGFCSSHLLIEWNVSDEFVRDGAVYVWSDSGLVLDNTSGASSAGSGMCAHVPVMLGGIVSGGTWIWCSPSIGVVQIPVELSVQSLVSCRRFKEVSCGGHLCCSSIGCGCWSC